MFRIGTLRYRLLALIPFAAFALLVAG